MLRKLTQLCLLALAFSVRLLAADPLDDIKHIPVSNPYRPVLEQYARLSQVDRDALESWVSPPIDTTPPPALTAGQKALARNLSAALVAIASSPPTTSADRSPAAHPEDPDNPFAKLIPAIGPIRKLARITAKDAESLPPSEAITTYAAIAQLGRQQRAGPSLLQQLMGVAIEGIAQAEASERLGTLSVAQLQQLSAAFSTLQPAPSLADSLAGERALFFQPFMEKIVLPGLRALLKEETDPASAPSSSDSERTFTRDLRLSGLLDLGDGERRVLLENTKTGAVLTLLENRAAEGITLTGIDFEKRLAYIRHEDREAVIHLQSKQIVERGQAAKKLLKFFEDMSLSPDARKRWLDGARAHPDGAEGYVQDLLATYDKSLAHQIALANQAKPSPEPETTDETDPLSDFGLNVIGKVGRTLHNSATQSTMLQAAIQLRLRELGHADATPPADPWAGDGSGFTVEKTPDGGFLMRSRYEARPDKPLTYKFAAPDAGFKRQP
jgi:hypothetical protein